MQDFLEENKKGNEKLVSSCASPRKRKRFRVLAKRRDGRLASEVHAVRNSPKGDTRPPFPVTGYSSFDLDLSYRMGLSG